jgi:DNA processing protein
MSDLLYLLALNSLSDVGPVTAGRLLAAFGTPENIFRMSADEIGRVEKVSAKKANEIAGFDNWAAVEREIDKAEKNDIRLVTFEDDLYPEGLRHINAAPLVFYIKGNINEVDKYAVAVVGSRKATVYGRQVAESLSRDLAASGLTIVSGMAAGVDTVSHRAALKAKGRTLAVLGSGLDVPYPASNRALIDSIAASGAVISEFPFGTAPLRENFPRRNRIISALSLGVIVVEGAPGSGSLITARYALEQGKEVFAVPGNLTSRNSKGPNGLIKKGAKLVESAEDVIEELSLQIKGILRDDKLRKERALPEMSGDENVIYDCLRDEPKHIDAIIRGIDIPTGRALSTLLNLELRGIVRQAEGKMFSIN